MTADCVATCAPQIVVLHDRSGWCIAVAPHFISRLKSRFISRNLSGLSARPHELALQNRFDQAGAAPLHGIGKLGGELRDGLGTAGLNAHALRHFDEIQFRMVQV